MFITLLLTNDIQVMFPGLSSPGFLKFFSFTSIPQKIWKVCSHMKFLPGSCALLRDHDDPDLDELRILFAIVPKQTLSLSTICVRSLLEEVTIILPGFFGSSAVSVSIEPNVFRSTVSLSLVYIRQSKFWSNKWNKWQKVAKSAISVTYLG